MANLGGCYLEGEGVEQNAAEAVKCFRKAAEAGAASGMKLLGACYFNGNGVEQNKTEGIKWIRKVADAGDTQASAYLAAYLEMLDGDGSLDGNRR